MLKGCSKLMDVHSKCPPASQHSLAGQLLANSTAQHSTAQHSTAQHSAAQHSTAHCGVTHHAKQLVMLCAKTLAAMLFYCATVGARLV